MRYRELYRKSRIFAFLKEIFKRNLDINFLQYRFKWNYYPRWNVVPAFPLHVDIETTDKCNLRCVMCVHGQGEVPNTGFIDYDFACRILEQCRRNNVASIKLNWRGEPTLYSRLESLIKYAKKIGILEVQLNTNGIPLTEERIKEIVHAGLDRIIFSVDGAKQQTYEKIRVGGDYQRLVKNIEHFILLRKTRGSKKPFIRVQMVRMTENLHEVEDFLNLWKGKADDLRITDATDRGQGDYLQVKDQITIGRRRCPQPWLRMVVSWDGLVFPCCSDWHRRWVAGDAKKQSLIDIWKSPRMSEIRQLNIENRLNDFEPCRSCFVKESYQWKKNL